jgi:hypothetical protein
LCSRQIKNQKGERPNRDTKEGPVFAQRLIFQN